MNRRSLLQGLAATPLLGFFMRSSEDELEPDIEPMVVPATPTVPTVKIGLFAAEMAKLLSANLDAYIATFPADWKWDPEEVRLQHRLCAHFCKVLLTPEEESDLSSSMFYPHQRDNIVDQVVFGVTTEPVASVYIDGVLQSKDALARRVRTGADIFTLTQDLAAFHPGLNAEEQLMSLAAEQAALEVRCEIRADHDQGNQIKVYAIYLPPFLSPVSPAMLNGDFSVDRRFRFRYAKFATA